MGSARELVEWQAFEDIEPFGERAADWRFARLAALVLNRLRFSEDTPEVRPEDLMPDHDGTIRKARQEREAARAAAGGGQQLTAEEWRELERRRREGDDGEEG